MDFALTEMQRDLVSAVRDFVKTSVIPRAARLDAETDPEKSFSWEIVEEASAAGIRTLTLAPEWGGAGIDTVTTAMVIEELAKGDLGVSVVFAQTLKIAQVLQAAATEDQKQRYLPAFRDDPRFLLSICFTEPDLSSNYIIPYTGQENRYRTAATRTQGGWLLNGMKHFVSNANLSKLYLVFAQTDPSKTLMEGSTCFLVPRPREGFSVGRVHDKMGERLANNAELFFNNVFVPDEDVLGEVNQGYYVQRKFFPASNAYAGASTLGVGQAAYEKALAWARQRVQGGRPLIEHATTREDLAYMRMMLDAARMYIWKCCWAAQTGGEEWDPIYGALPKVMGALASWQVTVKALELHGGYGYMKEIGMEKLVRDSAAFLHSDGTQRALLLKAANFIAAGG